MYQRSTTHTRSLRCPRAPNGKRESWSRATCQQQQVGAAADHPREREREPSKRSCGRGVRRRARAREDVAEPPRLRPFHAAPVLARGCRGAARAPRCGPESHLPVAAARDHAYATNAGSYPQMARSAHHCSRGHPTRAKQRDHRARHAMASEPGQTHSRVIRASLAQALRAARPHCTEKRHAHSSPPQSHCCAAEVEDREG